MKPPGLAASALLAAILWTAALVVDPGPLDPARVAAVGVGLLSCAAVGLVGMIVVGGRWARRLSLASVVAAVPLALVRPIDPLWAGALAASVLAGASLFHPRVTRRIRKLPAAAGPPPRAVVLPLLLLAVPYLLGLAAVEGPSWAVLVVSLSAPLAAFAYSRVFPGGLWAVRLAWPALGLGLAPLLALPGGPVSALLAAAVASVAWHPSVKTAYHPPREVGSTYPIPPELAPKEVLDAADLDERGRRR